MDVLGRGRIHIPWKSEVDGKYFITLLASVQFRTNDFSRILHSLSLSLEYILKCIYTHTHAHIVYTHIHTYTALDHRKLNLQKVPVSTN